MGISTLTLVPDHVIFLLLLCYPQCSHRAHTVYLLLFTPSLILFILPSCPSLLLFLTLCFFFNQIEHIILLINTHKFILYSIVSENIGSYLQLNIWILLSLTSFLNSLHSDFYNLLFKFYNFKTLIIYSCISHLKRLNFKNFQKQKIAFLLQKVCWTAENLLCILIWISTYFKLMGIGSSLLLSRGKASGTFPIFIIL